MKSFLFLIRPPILRWREAEAALKNAGEIIRIAKSNRIGDFRDRKLRITKKSRRVREAKLRQILAEANAKLGLKGMTDLGAAAGKMRAERFHRDILLMIAADIGHHRITKRIIHYAI